MNSPVVYRLQGDELHVIVDVSHDPWRTMGARLVELLLCDLNELGFESKNFEQLLQALADKHATLQ